MFEASQQSERPGKKAQRITAGDLLSCRVIAIGQSSVFVAVGDKAEGTIDLAEFRDSATGEVRISVGDEVQATVIDDGGASGTPVLTRMLGRGGNAGAEMEQALVLGVPVEGLVSSEIKGGFEIHFGSVRAFCPGSQIDLRRGGERIPASEYIGRRFAFRVTKADAEARNVVVSRRSVLEEEVAEQAARTWQNIHVGVVLEGTVRSLRDFGAFVDLGGVDGMIHISELAWARVGHPQEVLSAGQKVRVQVIKVDEKADKDGRRQVGLSLRALEEDPWSTAASRFAPGTTVAGTVRRVEAYGAFVEIAPGVEGLVHISKMSADRRLSHARQAATLGQQLEVTVLSVDPKERRLSLSMVERARAAEEAEAAEDKRDQDRVLGDQGTGSLGTFADLLTEARKK